MNTCLATTTSSSSSLLPPPIYFYYITITNSSSFLSFFLSLSLSFSLSFFFLLELGGIYDNDNNDVNDDVDARAVHHDLLLLLLLLFLREVLGVKDHKYRRMKFRS